jgi:hypothetical protein
MPAASLAKHDVAILVSQFKLVDNKLVLPERLRLPPVRIKIGLRVLWKSRLAHFHTRP